MRLFNQRTAPHPVAGEREPHAIFADEFGVVGIEGHSSFADPQGRVDFILKEEAEHLCLQARDIGRIERHRPACRLECLIKPCRCGRCVAIVEAQLVEIGERKKGPSGVHSREIAPPRALDTA